MRILSFFWGLVVTFGMLSLPLPATANTMASTPDSAITIELIPQHSTMAPGQPSTILWTFQMQDGWHIYYQNPGDSGLPPKAVSTNPAFKAGPLTYPTPHPIATPPITNYGYAQSTALAFDITPDPATPHGSQGLSLKLSFLYCKDICLPGKLEVTLPTTVGPKAEPNPAFETPWNVFTQTLPQPRADITASRQGSNYVLQAPTNFSLKDAHFIPDEDGLIDDSAPQTVQGNTLLIPADAQNPQPAQTLKGILTTPQGNWSVSSPLTTSPAAASHPANLTLPLALVFAFLAGLILNLMPCVLPVLSLKILGLVKTHHGAERMTHALAYTGGVISTFVGIGLTLSLLRHSGILLGWGFQLQSPTFTAGLALIMLALALNLWGVFEVGHSLGKLAGDPLGGRETTLGAFTTGILAVVVATPCTVPFMGGAIAFALSQSLWASLLTFTSLGLGLAAPFLLAAAFPALLRWMPKPGRWMLTLKHVLGWPMLLTAIWMLWVFTNQTNPIASFGLILLGTAFAFTLWLYGHYKTRMFLAMPIIVFLWGTGGLLHGTVSPRLADNPWQPWSQAAVEQAAQTQTVFVDFTADWCITCKVQEATVLNTAPVQNLFRQRNVALFRADWTKGDPAITQALESFGRRGVPLYVLYKKGEEPHILPQILTPQMLEGLLPKPEATPQPTATPVGANQP